MSTPKNKKVVATTVMPFPEGGRQKIKEFKIKVAAIEEKVQLYVDGLIVGLGIDQSQNPVVDLDAMTITFEKKEAENASES